MIGLFCVHMVKFKHLIVTYFESNNMSNVLKLDVVKGEIMVALLVDNKCIGKESFWNDCKVLVNSLNRRRFLFQKYICK